MSDPGTTYRTREEVQRMRSTQDPIRGLQRYIEDWGLATEQELKQLDKEAKAEVDAAVAEAKESSEPLAVDLWSDIYFKGTEPPYMRGRERDEVSMVIDVVTCHLDIWARFTTTRKLKGEGGDCRFTPAVLFTRFVDLGILSLPLNLLNLFCGCRGNYIWE